MKSREVLFTIEEIVEIYDPSDPCANCKGMVEVAKVTKGYADFDEQGELKNICIDDVKIDNKKAREKDFEKAQKDGVIGKLLSWIFK